MSSLNVMVPNPDGSGRYCVFDSVASRYVPGGINVSRSQAEKLIREVRPQQWEDLARQAGWVSPEQFGDLWKRVAKSEGWLPPGEVAKQLEDQAALTEAALTTKPEADEEQPAYHEAPRINSIGPDEL